MYSFITIGTKSRSWREPPALNITKARALGKDAVGYINYRTGEWYLGPWGRASYLARKEEHGASSMALGLQRTLNTNGVRQVMEIRVSN
jgi:DnaJ family protein C protein 11